MIARSHNLCCRLPGARPGKPMLAVAAVLAAMIVAGCSSSDANSRTNDGGRSQPRLPGDAGIVPRAPVPDDYVPLDDSI